LAGLIEELKRRKVFRVLVAYLVSAWLLLQVAEVLSSILSLPAWAPKLVLFLLAIGLVPALILAWAYELTPDGIKRDAEAQESGRQPVQNRLRTTVIVISVVLVASIGAGTFWISGANARWARNVAIPRIEQDLAADDWEQAYATALELRDRLPDWEILDDYWGQFTWRVSIPSEPAGAAVYRRAYNDPQGQWVRLGETPLYDVPVPKRYSLIRIEKEGFENLFRTLGGMPITGGTVRVDEKEDVTGTEYVVSPVDIVLEPIGDTDRSLVRVPGTQLMLDGELVRLADFHIGRNEVSNREYQNFVTAGGYRRQDLWEHEFIRDGSTLTWQEAMAAFVDTTGRPGPSTWIGGAFPDGQDDYPVGGISWYEAAAYARFAGMDLPTVHHWRRAHARAGVTWQIVASNVETNSVAPVGQFQGTGWTGTQDMLGNVREWCLNALGENRAILGGSWTDVPYAIPGTIYLPAILPPFDRSVQNGVRLVAVNDDRKSRDLLRQPVKPRETVKANVVASDQEFGALLRNFDYSDDPLRARIEESVDSPNWTTERISLDSGHGQRTELLLYLPQTDNSRHRTLIYWPSSLAIMLTSLDDFRLHVEFMLRTGWAVAMPIFERTFHRGDGQFTSNRTIAGRDLTIRQVRELRRTIDYLETRADLDTATLAFYGFSWGGQYGPLALAAEPRLKVAILNQAGLQPGRNYDIDPVHYLSRVKQPVLQFNGRFDTNFRYEDSAKPFFDGLGSEFKKHVVEPGGHFVSNSVVIGETLAWLDQHLGDSN
jgi:predicted esterase